MSTLSKKRTHFIILSLVIPMALLIGFVVLAGAALLIKRKAHNN